MNDQAADRLFESAFYKTACRYDRTAGGGADPAEWMEKSELGRMFTAALAEMRAGNARPDKLREIQSREGRY